MNRAKYMLAAVAAIFFFNSSCTVSQVVDVAVIKNPKAALRALGKNKVSSYKANPLNVINDIKIAKANYDTVVRRFKKLVGKNWGEKETIVADTKHYVKYTHNYKSRAIVDFDEGTILVETIDDGENTGKNLQGAIITTLLTPADPRSVVLFSDATVELKGKPYLEGLVVDHRNKKISSPEDAEGYAAYLTGNKLEKRNIETEEGQKGVSFVSFYMVNDFTNKQAEKFEAKVNEFTEKFRVSRSMIYAVIKIESGFNPYAVSSAPAYGLMQLVPSSGGRDAYNYAKGEDWTPTREYLFDSGNNIELGTAYLTKLLNESFKEVSDPVAREYCVVAAYNTGPGNVYRTFSGNKKKVDAINAINALKPGEVYEKLRKDLPYEETRNYIANFIDAKKRFVKM